MPQPPIRLESDADVDRHYADLLKDLADAVEQHSAVANSIASSALATLADVLDPKSKQEADVLVRKLTSRMVRLQQDTEATRTRIQAKLHDALETIRVERAATVASLKSQGQPTKAVRDTFFAQVQEAQVKAEVELRDALATFMRESVRSQEQAVSALSQLTAGTSSADVVSSFDRLEKWLPTMLREQLETQTHKLSSLLKGSSVTPVRNDSGSKPEPADAADATVDKPAPKLSARTENSAWAAFMRSYGKSRDTYKSIKDRSERSTVVRALASLADWARTARKNAADFGWLDAAAIGAAIAAAMSGLLPDVLSRFPALKMLTAALDAIRDFKPAQFVKELRPWLETQWAAIRKDLTIANEFLKAKIVGPLEAKIVPILEAVKESPLIKGVSSILDNVKEATVGRVASGFNQVKNLVGTAASEGASALRGLPGSRAVVWAGENIVNPLAKGAAWAGGKVAGLGANIASGVASMAGTSLLRAAQKLVGNPVSEFILKNLGRLGNLAMVLDVVTGVYEEATGKKADPLTMLDYIFNPMKVGRRLGSKFNDLFERVTGTSFGSFIYDHIGNDPNAAAVEAMLSGKPATTPVRASVAPARPSVAPPVTAGVSTPTQTGGAAGTTPSLTPSSIPDFAGIDPATNALMVGAVHP